MHESQGTQFADLSFVDRRLEAEIELLECLQVRQVRQLQPGLEVTLAPRVGFRVHDFDEEAGIRGFFPWCWLCVTIR